MGDLVKIGVKTALIAVIVGALIAVFTQVNIPSPDFSGVYTAVSKALAIVRYWFPALGEIWTLALGLMGIRLLLYGVQFTLQAVRWVMKVNE